MKRNKKFEKSEIDFIIEHYPSKGAKYCAAKLNRTVVSVRRKIERIKTEDKIDIRCSEQYKNQNLQKENLQQFVNESISFTDLCLKIYNNDWYGNRQTLKKYIKKHQIDTSHFGFEQRKPTTPRTVKSLSELLVENCNTNTTDLKIKLYKSKLKKEECELCGQGPIWCGKKMSLRLDHINGINTDNRIENLQIVCPNCDATLDTFSGKNVKRNKAKKINKIVCKCGKDKYRQSQKCLSCYNKSRIKTNRPSLPILLQEVKELGYCATGRKYNVSDNCIRKWIKQYQK